MSIFEFRIPIVAKADLTNPYEISRFLIFKNHKKSLLISQKHSNSVITLEKLSKRMIEILIPNKKCIFI